VSLPAVTAPKGGGAIRSIGETFRADAVTGTGTLAVPLPLSPARGGSGPKLTLSYDSGQGQGAFGIGWSLDVPSIGRRTDKGLPQYRDAEESDEFVLTGAEVLVPALVDEGAGPVRDAFFEGGYFVERFRPRVEGAYARIERRRDLVTGDVHWRTVSRDGTTSLFGRSPSARLADPKDPRRVFRWMLEATIDDRGNATWLEYKPEDTANVLAGSVEERRRLADPTSFANLYVKRIHYGNRAPLATADPEAADLNALAWLFEVVFDYGEHDASAPAPDETQPWACRPDPFSSFRATFDVRTYRLCRRVLMFHRFDELGAVPVIVRSLDLSYRTAWNVTTLGRVEEKGWLSEEAGVTTAAMPALDFDYTSAELHTEARTLDPEGAVPGGVDGLRFRFVDLDGEGVPGALSQQGGALFYRRNEGGGRLGAMRALPRKPNLAAIGGVGQALMSLDGDGKMDLVLSGALRGSFRRDAEKDAWGPFRPFARAPNFPPGDPNLRYVDVDGDGVADVMLAQGHAFFWCKSLGRDGFGQVHAAQAAGREDEGPPCVFAPDSHTVFLADMTGDGMMDVVRVRNGEICYWPNLGYGRYGPKITMGNAPRFDRPDRFDPRRIRFGDLDGSGTSDIAYLVPEGGVAIYLNLAGNRWSDGVTVPGVPTRSDTTVELCDLLGTGTACLVWSSQGPRDARCSMRYVDLLGSTKPHLLCRVTNNLGLETRVAYAPSTRYYLEDRRAGTPWVTRLPFPVQVIARVETADHVQKTRLVTTYRYKHGFYDGVERELRGFGRVDQWDAESYASAHGAGLMPPGLNEQDGEFRLPPVHTVSWFDTGAWRERQDLFARYRAEQYGLDPVPPLPDPWLPAGLASAEEREGTRARRGTLLRREVYAEDGTAAAAHPYVVEEHRYQVQCLQPMGKERHAVFACHEEQAVVTRYERNPADPRTEHTFSLEVDAYGNVLRSAHVAYPRRAPAEPEQAALLATCAEASFVNETGASYRIGVPVEARAYELTGPAAPAGGGLLAIEDVDAATKAAAPIAFDAAPAPGALQKRLLSHRRTLYSSDDLTGPLPLGSVGARALVYEAYAKSMTASLVGSAFGGAVTPAVMTSEGGYVDLLGDGDLWRPSGRPTYDPTRFYQATTITDPFGNTARIVLDAYALLPVEAHTSDDPAVDNVTLAQNDYRVLRPALVTDPNGNQTALAFDALGMVVAIAVMGKPGTNEGDTLADPTTRLEYDVLAWQKGLGPAYVHTFAREQHGAANTRWLESYSYSDGSGREVMKKVQAEPDASGRPRWVGTGRTVFDDKGNPVKKYEPYFSATPAYEDEPSIVMQGVTPILRYDPLGRCVRTDLPEGTFETVEFDAWSETRADANDDVLESAWYAANEALPASDPRRRAADLAAQHAHTPAVRSVDPLGRTFLVVEDNAGAGKVATRTAIDIQGNALRVTDARGNVALAQTFDMEGRVLASTSIDAGEKRALRDVAGNVVRAGDARGFIVRTTYDRLRRPACVYVTPPGGGEILAERIVYGEAMADGATPADHGKASNLRGRKVLHYDGAGELYLSAYDFQGNLRAAARQLARTYQTTPDWTALAALADVASIRAQAAPLLESEPFVTATVYDALDRPMRTTTPDGSVLVPTYDEASLLQAVHVNVRGAATATTFVDDIQYDAKGQRVQIVYGDDGRGGGTMTTVYTYDPLTFRLAQLKTTRASDAAVLQNLGYTYDPVGNVTAIGDSAQQKVFFDDDVVLPAMAYVYDALYRLVRATGREQAGGNADVQCDQNDVPLFNLPHANDAQAVRTYEESYAYDAVGNILQMVHDSGAPATCWTRRYQIDAGSNRLLGTSLPGDQAGEFSARYGHDAAGNMTSMPHLSSVGWDWRGQMASADLGGGGEVYFACDAGGQRVRKVWEHGGIVEERIYIGGWEVYRRRDVTGLVLERQTLHVMDGVKRVALVETTTADASTGGAFQAATVTRYQLGNHLGSSVLEVDAAGNVLSYEEYHPYGMTAYHSGTGAAEVSLKRYRYTGKERDEETGLYYYGARYYPPWLGRWTSADPAGMVDGPGLYNYARCNPVTLSDPSGRATPAPGSVDYQIMTMTDPQLYRHMRTLEASSPGALASFLGDAHDLFKVRAEAMKAKYGMVAEAPKKGPEEPPPPAPGTLSVDVRYTPLDAPIKDAMVTVEGPAEEAALTDETGAVKFENMPPGKYTISAAYLGRHELVDLARSKLGSTDWAFKTARGDVPADRHKCNVFVYEMATEAGYNVPLVPHAKLGGFGKTVMLPPVAGQWASPTEPIGKSTVVDLPEPGDVAAWAHSFSDASGHVAIVSYPAPSDSQGYELKPDENASIRLTMRRQTVGAGYLAIEEDTTHFWHYYDEGRTEEIKRILFRRLNK
jgi:RHS repeat-associated protein